MSDDEVRKLRNSEQTLRTPHESRIVVERLADEALARGKAEAIEKMKREATEGIAQQMAQEYDALRERVAQLEIVVQFYAKQEHYKWDIIDHHPHPPLVDIDMGDKARAALASGKP